MVRIGARAKFSWLDPLAGEQHFLGRHLAECQSQREPGNGEESRAAKNRRQDSGEILVSYRVWSHEIHRSGKRLGADSVLNSTDDVGYVNPTPPLAARSDAATEAQFERGQ